MSYQYIVGNITHLCSLCSNLDVKELLDGVCLNVDSKFLQSGDMLGTESITRFKSEANGQEYSLSILDSNESESLRLLVPDENQDKLVPFWPFKGLLNLTSVVSGVGENVGDGSSNIQTDLLLAPAQERAPQPAFDQSGNGAVDKMRLAYVPVVQREGLKRRWAMPGSRTPQPLKHQKEVAADENMEPKRSHKKAKKVKA